MKITTIVGARPQFIKAAAVSRVIKKRQSVTETIVHTGQHYDNNMSPIFFEEMEIPHPKYHLGIGSDTHGAQTGKMLEAIEKVLVEEKPDCTIVYGDTNSTLAGAVAAVKLHIPVAHVEAGLRSFNRRMPEEINRVLTDHASDILFAPTEISKRNLSEEGIKDGKIYLVGDIMYDNAVFYGDKAQYQSSILSKLNLQPKEYILATIHRAENTDDDKKLSAIFESLVKTARENKVILPLHPRTRSTLLQKGIFNEIERDIMLIDPVGYIDMIMLEKNARLIATDSGGVQKEAFFYRVPCVTLRDETEWIELVELGWNRVIRPDNTSSITREILSALDSRGEEGAPYGEGNAAEAIINILSDLLT
jgi:UDP-GlcNAc3NAcA epimerase